MRSGRPGLKIAAAMPIGRVVRAVALALVVVVCPGAAVAGPEDLASVRRFLASSPSQAELDVLVDAVTGAPGSPGVAARDADAYRLLSLGYSARETADIVSGRISRRALDTARRMLAVGQRPEAAEAYLDREYKRVIALRTPPRDPRWVPTDPSSPVDALIDLYADMYKVSAALVRAMIAIESGFDPRARSPKGAIGLMQLMPGTARELGVNPWVIEENIAGGVRYVAEMLRRFGSTELALIAYNGGPGYARRYARREVGLYGETRDYVRKVLARVGAGSR